MSHAYDVITDQILAQLEAGTVPWRQPWRTPGVPKNLFTQRSYRGINVWLLLARPYASPYWTTYRQVQEIGGWVRKGEKGTTVMFWKFADDHKAEGSDEPLSHRRAPLLRTYTVFNVEQCELPSSLRERLAVPASRPCTSLVQCERVLKQMPHPPRLVHEVPRAFYAPSSDLVNLPPRFLFETEEKYFATAFHEYLHSTGHPSRLARPGIADLAPFASHAYSKEELIAEMGAAYLCGYCGIAPQTLENAAAYVASWLEHLQNEKTLLLHAASQALVGNDARLLAAHRMAVTSALAELERVVQTRQHGGQERVTTGNMVAATFTHVAARPSQSGQAKGLGPDPHLHTHVVLMNMTRRADGQWRAVEPLELYRSQEHATAVYRTTLAQEVQRLGYRVARTGPHGAWELEGFSRTQIEQFSQRRHDISTYLHERGLDSPAAAQIAAHQTRLPKEGRDEATLRAEWMARAAAIGLDLRHVMEAARTRGPLEQDAATQQERTRDAVDYATAHRTEREAVVDTRALEATALQRGMGVLDLAQVRTEIRHQTAQRQLIPVTNARAPVDSYTTPEMLRLEEANIELMWAGQGQAEPVAESREVFAWALQRGLTVDQMRVAVQTLTAKDWLTAIEGKAGATKTTTIGALRELIEQQGATVQGFGPTTGSVRALEETGVQARTVASLLASQAVRGQFESQQRSVWIIDESSLLSTRQVHGLLQRAREEGIGRVIFVGDQRQHGAVEAGKPIAQMQQAGMRTARLDVIRRQKDPALRAAVTLAAQGKTAQAAQQLIGQGRVTAIPERDARFALIAREYARSVEHNVNVLVVAPANDERVALNTAIRAELQQRGQLPREGSMQTVLIRRDLTTAEKAWSGSYTIGDVVQVHRGSAKLGIAANSYATVEAVDREQNLLTVRTQDQQTRTYRPTQLRGVDVFQPEHRVFAVGERIQFRAPFKDQQIANGALGRMEKIDETRGVATIRLDSGKVFAALLEALRHIDYGYTTTSHSSQGMTVDQVLVHIDTDRSAQLVNRQQFYVSISRARLDVQVFANNVERLPAMVARELVKTTAREAVQKQQQDRERVQKQNRHHVPVHTPERPAQRTEWRHERVGQQQQRSKPMEREVGWQR